MAYVRKTRDVYEVQVRYSTKYGYERVCTEETLREANERKIDYLRNQPEYPVRVVKKREPIEAAV